MNRKIVICAMIASFVAPVAAYPAGKKAAEYTTSWTYNQKSRTWKAKAVKKETTSQMIERLRKKSWRKR
jgi:hypothetical protein